MSTTWGAPSRTRWSILAFKDLATTPCTRYKKRLKSFSTNPRDVGLCMREREETERRESEGETEGRREARREGARHGGKER